MTKGVLAVAAIVITASCGDGSETRSPTAPSAPPAPPANIAGTWTGLATSQIFVGSVTGLSATFVQSGADVTGTLACPGACLTRNTLTGMLRGTMSGSNLTAEVTFPDNASCSMFNGTLSDGALSGTYRCSLPPLADQGTWRMTRQ